MSHKTNPVVAIFIASKADVMLIFSIPSVAATTKCGVAAVDVDVAVKDSVLDINEHTGASRQTSSKHESTRRTGCYTSRRLRFIWYHRARLRQQHVRNMAVCKPTSRIAKAARIASHIVIVIINKVE
jgi:anaerobic selenocysteine-containing dehydrogenase